MHTSARTRLRTPINVIQTCNTIQGDMLKTAARKEDVTKSHIVDFARLWLAYRHSGGLGSPPLPPTSFPPTGLGGGRGAPGGIPRYLAGSPAARTQVQTAPPYASPGVSLGAGGGGMMGGVAEDLDCLVVSAVLGKGSAYVICSAHRW